MQSTLSSIEKILLREGGTGFHRQIVVLAGEAEWQKDILHDVLSKFASESLWVGESASKNILSVARNKASAWLGKEKKLVVFDANKDFDPDSFAVISGIVVGGGFFFLLLPEKEKWNEVYSSCFGQRLIKSIHACSELVVITPATKKISFSFSKFPSEKIPFCRSPFLTTDQQSVVEVIEKQILNKKNTPIVLVSDRGRGKSAALGITIAKIIQQGIKSIVITAPRLSVTDIVFKHISDILPEAIISRGCIKYKESVVQFYSPDRLFHDNINTEVLMIDEAAAIPVPLLTSFLHKYSQCVFATTVHGYEGTGRGFSLRFFKTLDAFNSNWMKLQMQEPIRWAQDDPLENWMFNLLCLDADIYQNNIPDELDLNQLEYCFVSKQSLIESPELLKEIFSLLVLAHYRTRPKDLKSLLDDKNISLYAALSGGQAVAVALIMREGSFSNLLSTEVYRGKRRPQGHLLAQTLTYHCGIEHAATLNYARVMRIAVHPKLQYKRIGTTLLNFIIQEEKEKGRDVIGTSFGMNQALLDFWHKSKFEVIRIGFTREQTSGEHAAVMMLELKGKSIGQEAVERFKTQLPYWCDDVLKDIYSEIKINFKIKYELNSELTERDKKDLHSFIEYSRNYELCIAAINKVVLLNADKINNRIFAEEFRQVIYKKVTEKMDWSVLAKSMCLNGKKAARNLFRQAIILLISI